MTLTMTIDTLDMLTTVLCLFLYLGCSVD